MNTAANSVLIIEDDIGAREAFEPMLRSHGYDVRVAVDGRSGVAAIRNRIPDALLLDLHLQDTNGVEFLRRCRGEFGRALRSAIITGDYLLDESVIRDIERLDARIFFKPLWEEDLVRIVRTLIAPVLL
jgi:DNA-binding response OmpR family regulator